MEAEVDLVAQMAIVAVEVVDLVAEEVDSGVEVVEEEEEVVLAEVEDLAARQAVDLEVVVEDLEVEMAAKNLVSRCLFLLNKIWLEKRNGCGKIRSGLTLCMRKASVAAHPLQPPVAKGVCSRPNKVSK